MHAVCVTVRDLERGEEPPLWNTVGTASTRCGRAKRVRSGPCRSFSRGALRLLKSGNPTFLGLAQRLFRWRIREKAVIPHRTPNRVGRPHRCRQRQLANVRRCIRPPQETADSRAVPNVTKTVLTNHPGDTAVQKIA